MTIDRRQLRSFAPVAGERHYGRAAQRLLMAQPSLSHQIRLMDHNLRPRYAHGSSRLVERFVSGLKNVIRDMQGDAT